MTVMPANRVVRAGRRPAALRRAGPVAAVLAGAALLAGGCAADSSNTAVASVPTASPSASPSSGQSGSDDAVKYSQCMRSHGVPKFPDPNPQGGIAIDKGKLGVDPRGTVFKAAEEACKSVRPQGPPPDPKQAAAVQQQFLAYSRCMRSHGVKNFPDPKFDGGGAQLSLPNGVNPNSPQFKAADQTCRKLMPQAPAGGPQGGAGTNVSSGGDS
jgi:hypothetical protein